ncbi:MAG: glycosyltransferase family 4 protein [Solirubrobacteraceae bacterium]
MRIQLWSYNYDPEPIGIAPVSAVWAQAMKARGHEVEVVAAHPHYPEPVWGHRLKPYREWRDGVRVLRLPLWVGRGSALQRVRQEASFASALSLAAPMLRTPDIVVAVSPSFPALVPAMANARARRIPWVLWLQDILPDGAMMTGILDEGRVVRAARRIERAAYRSASKIVVISESFKDNLRGKGVAEPKLVRCYNPATRPIRDAMRDSDAIDPRTVLTMGNIGHSQNLVNVVRSFEESSALRELGARFVLVGDGEAGRDVRAAIATDRVRATGVLSSESLERELRRATVAVVSQRYDGVEFNVPSKLMNFMAYGIPTVASVRADSEAARIIEESGGGWVTDSADTRQLAAKLAEVITDVAGREARGEAALAFARCHFAPEHVAQRFEVALVEAAQRRDQCGAVFFTQ